MRALFTVLFPECRLVSEIKYVFDYSSLNKESLSENLGNMGSCR